MSNSSNDSDAGAEPKRIDFRRIHFPSDVLTIRDIRDHEPDRIDSSSPQLSTDDAKSIEKLLFLERYIVEAAFEVAIGSGPEYRTLAREGGYREYENELTEEYIFYGLARTGLDAKELIRGFKEQARSQAREAQGLDPNEERTGRE